MKIEFKAGDTITIPEGCKAIVKDGSVVFEKIQEFKDGDILIYADYSDHRCPFIYKGTDTRGRHEFYAGVNSAKRIVLSDNAEKRWGNGVLQQATEEEKQQLFDKMKEQGLRWNAEEKRVEKIRRRAKRGDLYYRINLKGYVLCEVDRRGVTDKSFYDTLNYFHTEEQAREAAKRVRETLRKFHEEKSKI
mgnify:CR=1 FL=1|jgi:hypothetical protein|nr:MAG TPA: hypothetical protein [Caudoviricetes sp.]